MIEVDVAVVGAGPAGIAAAASAAEGGSATVLVDENPRAGGQIWRHGEGESPSAARPWLERLARSGARHLAGASVFDARRDGERWALGIDRAGGAEVVRARAIVLAAGARELFLPFPGWTLPGVFGVGGAQALLKAGTSFASRRVVIAGSGPLLLPVAASLAKAGARVALVAEQAPTGAVARFAAGLWRRPGALADAARYRLGFAATPYALGTWVTEALGDDRVRAVTVTDGRTARRVACDVLCTGYGLVPNTEIARHLGCELAHGAVVVNGRQESTVDGVFCAGELTGVSGVDLALVEGEIAGRCAAGRDDAPIRLATSRERWRRIAASMGRAFAPRAELRALAGPETIVCRCEDVPLGAIDPAWSPRQVKLYTRAGMGPCQGRVCGAALAALRGWAESDAVRLPTQPVSVAALGGALGAD